MYNESEKFRNCSNTSSNSTLRHCNTIGVCSSDGRSKRRYQLTTTDQSLKQKNTGSGESHNSNCGQNLIKAGVGDQECDLED